MYSTEHFVDTRHRVHAYNYIVYNSSDIPSRFRNDHFGAEFMELLPEFLRFEVTLDTGQLTALRGVDRAAVLTRLHWLSRLPVRRTVPGVFHEFLCNTDGSVWCFLQNQNHPMYQSMLCQALFPSMDIQDTCVCYSDVTRHHYRHTRDGRTSVLHGPGLGPRAGPARSPWAGSGLNNILRAGPGAGLKLEGPGRARACKY